MKPLRRSSHRKISLETCHQLTQIHLHMGYAESRRASIEAGVNEKYAANRAREVAPKKVYGGSGSGGGRTTHDDPRWAWAVERGAVIA